MKSPINPCVSKKATPFAVLLAFPLLGIASRASAGVVYTQIASNMAITYPAINDNGVVAFEGRFATSSGVYSGTGGSLTTIGAGVSTSAYNVWINDSNQVTFVNNTALGVFSVSRGTGGELTTIHTYSQAAPHETTFTLPVIANDGTVTFITTNSGIYSGTGGPLTTVLTIPSTNATLYDDTFAGVAVSHNGTLAYASFSSSNQQIVVNRSGVETPVLTLSTRIGSGAGVASIAVNNDGVAAVVASLGTDAPTGLFLADGTNLVNAVSDTPFFQVAGNASINDAGQVAFLADSSNGSTSVQGIYTGSDPIADKIIQTGDPLSGSIVTQLAIGTDALNDSGQVTFWAHFANGTSGVFTATAAPEPGSLGILTLASAPLIFRRRKSKI